MSTLLLHLSDIHITSDEDVIFTRIDLISRTLPGLGTGIDQCVVVVTGDVAYSGKEAEYMAAYEWFTDLSGAVEEALSISSEQVRFILVPGNHDCDFSSDNSARDQLIAAAQERPERMLNESYALTLTMPQDAFFDLRDAMDGEWTSPFEGPVARMYYEYLVESDGIPIRFHCINTAATSQRHEVQGKLVIPPSMAPERSAEPAIEIALSHHGYNWLQHENARAVREVLDTNCDLYLTGHEHQSDNRQIADRAGRTQQQVDGAVLQESGDPSSSGFHVWLLDTAQVQAKFFSFHWTGARYELNPDQHRGVADIAKIEWAPLELRHPSARSPYMLEATFSTYLGELGVGVHHRTRGEVHLHDVFTMPHLIATVDLDGSPTDFRVPPDEVPRRLRETPVAVIRGAGQSGKTSLAKALVTEFHRSGAVPVLISGATAKITRGKTQALIHERVTQQYGEAAVVPYSQLAAKDKVVIVDDFDLLTPNARTRSEFLADLAGSAANVILLGDEMRLSAGELRRGVAKPHLEMIEFEILPMSRSDRHSLIGRWLALDHTLQDSDEFARQLLETTRTIDQILGRGIVPALPLFVLSLLQARDAAFVPIDSTASTHGHYYELLIKADLARGRDKPEYDIAMSYLTSLARRMHSLDRMYLSEVEALEVHREFLEHWGIRRDLGATLHLYVDQRILTREQDRYAFRFNYAHNYFVASGLVDASDDDELREQTERLAAAAGEDASANILQFIAHLTSNPVVLEALVSASAGLFAEGQPAGLSVTDMDFLKAKVRPDTLELTEGDHVQMQQSELKKADLREEELADAANSEPPELLDPLFLSDVTRALRTQEILGQILKNNPASITASKKIELAEASTTLALRLEAALFALMAEDQAGILSYLVETLRRELPELSEPELRRRAREQADDVAEWAAEIALRVGLGFTNRIASTAGSADLIATFDQVAKQQGTPAVSLVSLAVHLEYGASFPASQVARLADEFEDNLFALAILRRIVWRHFLLVPEPDYSLKQKICAQLNIDYKALRTIEGRELLLKPRSND